MNMTENNTKTTGITGSTLKIIAIITMFIDHVGAIIVEGYLNKLGPSATTQSYMMEHPEVAFISMLDNILRLTGRLGFPLFVFLLIEGFTYTKSKWKYGRNLFIFALISEIPFNLGFQNRLFYPAYQNVFFTLLIGLIVLSCIKYLAEERVYSEKISWIFYPVSFLAGCLIPYMLMNTTFFSLLKYLIPIGFNTKFIILTLAVAVIFTLVMAILFTKKWNADKKNRFAFTLLFICLGVLAAELLQTDYSGFGVLTIVVMYYFRKNKTLQMAMGCAALTFFNLVEATAFFTIIPISKYNGKRGLSLKYVFYAFYPLHILLLYGIAYLCGIVGFAIK